MKKKKIQNKREVNRRLKSSVQAIIVATENMMAMPKSIILKIKNMGDRKNEK